MRRREFVGLVGGAAAWPMTARAQQTAMPVIGVLSSASSDTVARQLAIFRRSLSENGFVEGRNLAIEYRFADGQYDRLPALAADLARSRVAVFVTNGSIFATQAAQTASTTIPIVFSIGTDPIEAGLVPSLTRPTGNMTGVTSSSSNMASKQVGLLHEIVPNVATIAVLVNQTNPVATDPVTKDVQTAGRAIGRQIVILNASTEREIDAAFATLVRERTGALVVAPDAFFRDRRAQLVALAAQHSVPTIYPRREFAEVGGLMSYES
jgi:ABC-type uncharacterized transport system substrate-binding protein